MPLVADIPAVADKRFEGERVEIDNVRFERCTFFRCEMIYTGEGEVSFDGCTFIECEWTLAGPAENVLHFLEDLYAGLGREGESMVEDLFATIRDGGSMKLWRPSSIRPDRSDARQPVGA